MRLFPFVSGGLFSFGLAFSGMTRPGKVRSFLDVFGAWDPSLAFVMGGAVVVNVLLFAFILRRDRPFAESVFHVPTRTVIDRKLIIGSALFGAGWGLAGYCPGPGVASIATLEPVVITFFVAMVLGMAAFHLYEKRRGALTRS